MTIGALQRALLLSDADNGPSSAQSATIAHLLARAYAGASRYDEAERLYRRALDAFDARRQQRRVADILQDLGALAHARGNHVTGDSWTRCSEAVRAAVSERV